jgi:hypothetical protein
VQGGGAAFLVPGSLGNHQRQFDEGDRGAPSARGRRVSALLGNRADCRRVVESSMSAARIFFVNVPLSVLVIRIVGGVHRAKARTCRVEESRFRVA